MLKRASPTANAFAGGSKEGRGDFFVRSAAAIIAGDGAVGIALIGYSAAIASGLETIGAAVALVIYGPPSIAGIVAAIGIVLEKDWAWWTGIAVAVISSVIGIILALDGLVVRPNLLFAFLGPIIAVLNLSAVAMLLLPTTRRRFSPSVPRGQGA